MFKGELRDGSQVAIKAIDLAVVIGKGEAAEDAGFDDEIMMLSKFRHPRLFLGSAGPLGSDSG